MNDSSRLHKASQFAVNLHAKRYAPTKIAALLAVGRDAGLAEDALLEGSQLDVQSVMQAATTISIAQYLHVARNLVRLYPGPDVGIQVGKRLTISQYGIYGYAVLCAGTLRQACDITARYAPLGTPVFLPSLREESGLGVWTFPPINGIKLEDLDLDLCRFLIEAQFLIIANGTKELMGSTCRPSGARFAMPKPSDTTYLEQALDCPIQFDQAHNELDFDGSWLDRPPRLASPIVAAQVCQTLSKQLNELQASGGISHRVCVELTRVPAHFPSIDELPIKLSTTSRTLRRRLTAEGTSYQELLDHVRRTMAQDYLISTQLNADDIALILGFSDAASFRNAFKRWTGFTLSQFRRKV